MLPKGMIKLKKRHYVTPNLLLVILWMYQYALNEKQVTNLSMISNFNVLFTFFIVSYLINKNQSNQKYSLNHRCDDNYINIYIE